MLTKCSFSSRAISASSKLSWAITWHQWHDGVADRQEDRLLLASGQRQRLRAPRPPIHRIAGVLQQIGAQFCGKKVGHLRALVSFVDRHIDTCEFACLRQAINVPASDFGGELDQDTLAEYHYPMTKPERTTMSAIRHLESKKLPDRFGDLVQIMPPRVIRDAVGYENTVEMVDRLMAAGRLSKGQSLYLETLVQLVQGYEAEHHAIDTTGISGLDSLKHLLEENGMNASDLARLLGVHPSMGSKILRGERALTVDHIRTLCERFRVDPRLFMD